MRRTKYYPRYGYVSGKGIGDLFNFAKSGFSKIQPFVKPAIKSVATKVAAATGDRVGSKIASRIAPKPSVPRVDREDILRDLRLNEMPSSKDLTQQGFGRKKIRGGGLKILV